MISNFQTELGSEIRRLISDLIIFYLRIQCDAENVDTEFCTRKEPAVLLSSTDADWPVT